MSVDVLAALDWQARHYLARARADDRPRRPVWRRLLAALVAFIAQPLPQECDYRRAARRWTDPRRTWAQLGPLAQRRLAFAAMADR